MAVLDKLIREGWRYVKDEGTTGKWSYLEKTYLFTDFAKCFSFMTGVALMSERMDHHPDWLNIYNKVTIKWSTHTERDITEKDLLMAQHCDQFAEKYS